MKENNFTTPPKNQPHQSSQHYLSNRYVSWVYKKKQHLIHFSFIELVYIPTTSYWQILTQLLKLYEHQTLVLLVIVSSQAYEQWLPETHTQYPRSFVHLPLFTHEQIFPVNYAPATSFTKS